MQPTSRPAFTALWRNTTEGMEAPNATYALQKSAYHPALNMLGTELAKVTLAITVGCDPLANDHPSTSGLVDSYLDLLNGPAVDSLVSALTDVGVNRSWNSYWNNGRLNNNAIFCTNAEDQEEMPMATCILNLNEDVLRVQHFQDPHRAELIIVVYPEVGGPVRALTLERWHLWLLEVLKLPGLFASFLTEQIGVRTHDEPIAVVGIMLTASTDLTQLVDVLDARRPPSWQVFRQFQWYLLADRNGKQPPAVAVDALRVLCDHGLRVLGYEKQLDMLR